MLRFFRTRKQAVLCLVLITLGTRASALPPDTNNAALLYYQAFLLRPEPDYAAEQLVYKTGMEEFVEFLRSGKLEFATNTEEQIRQLEEGLNDPNKLPSEMREMIPKLREVLPDEQYKDLFRPSINALRERLRYEQKMTGVDPNKTIRDYMKKCRDAIEKAQAASEITGCDWGSQYSRGINLGGPSLVEIRNFAMILCSDALLRAADGDYRAAFDRCLMIRRFSRHVGEDTYLFYCVSQAVDSQALRCIRVLLGHVEPNVETLSWLKSRLVAEGERHASFRRLLNTESELALQSLRINTKMLENAHKAMRMKVEIIRLANGQPVQTADDANDLQVLTDEELIALAAKPYSAFLDSALEVMDSEMPYEQKVLQIESLTEKIKNEFGQDPASIPVIAAHPEKLLTFSIVMLCADQVPGLYKLQAQYKMHFNALLAGIEIHLVKARTGRLPKELPAGLPKDPFSGKDFIYKITEDGFELSLPDKNIPKPRYKPFEFWVHK